MKDILVLDTESNTWNKGNPFDQRFKSVCYSWGTGGNGGAVRWTPESTQQLGGRISAAQTIVGFHLKYDIHVLRTQGILLDDKRVWCCQLAEFILSRQRQRYPSLEDSLS